MIQDYLMGERAPMIDLMAWNADATRMPYRMHSEYLRHLFLNNDLAEGRYDARGPAGLAHGYPVPVFAVGTVTDHVAPWRSVYKIHLLTNCRRHLCSDAAAAITPASSTSPGTRTGITRSRTTAPDPTIDPDELAGETPGTRGSWWPELAGLAERTFNRERVRRLRRWARRERLCPSAGRCARRLCARTLS